MYLPVMVWVGIKVARLNLPGVTCKLGGVIGPLVHLAGCLDQMEGQHGQGMALGCFSKAKDVKLPVVLSILQSPGHARVLDSTHPELCTELLQQYSWRAIPTAGLQQ